MIDYHSTVLSKQINFLTRRKAHQRLGTILLCRFALRIARIGRHSLISQQHAHNNLFMDNSRIVYLFNSYLRSREGHVDQHCPKFLSFCFRHGFYHSRTFPRHLSYRSRGMQSSVMSSICNGQFDRSWSGRV